MDPRDRHELLLKEHKLRNRTDAQGMAEYEKAMSSLRASVNASRVPLGWTQQKVKQAILRTMAGGFLAGLILGTIIRCFL